MLAQYADPIIFILLLVVSLFGTTVRDFFRFWIISAVAIGVATGLAELGKALVIWPGHPTFPSGHEAFGAATAMCIVARKGYWLPIVMILLLALAWGLVTVNFHSIVDVAAGLVLGIFIALIVQRLLSRFDPMPADLERP